VELAEQICRRMPSLEMMRLVNSGTEAAMSAIRLARGVTGRDIVVKFAGCYHGHSDAMLAQAGSGVATLSIPGSAGVPQGTVSDTLVLPFNDLDALSALFSREGERIAAVIVEPVAGNMGVVLPGDGFLQLLRGLTAAHGTLLIFDEVITGFRVGSGGAQGLFGIVPDLTCLGKVIGGGLPVGAFGGRRELMSHLAPEGDVYQAGTLSGNPLAVAAGLATLALLEGDGPYLELEARSALLEAGIVESAQRSGVPVQVNRVGSMLTVYLTASPVTDYPSAMAADRDRFALLHHELLRRGVFWPPSGYESAFLSLRHELSDVEAVVASFAAGFEVVAARATA
jgi:glutamate-1-semialdehyde 2,1-aminomutase